MGALWDADEAAANPELATLIEVPIQVKRCGVAVRLVLCTVGQTLHRGPDPKLQGLLANANDWFERLSCGKSDSVMAIAQQENVTGSYVTRVIQLAFLAPDIVQRIHRGDHPLELNANRLIRMVPLPLAWGEQRALLGMGD